MSSGAEGKKHSRIGHAISWSVADVLVRHGLKETLNKSRNQFMVEMS